jgi:multicomponent Na+:H+ antiporter subunit E
MMSVAALFVFLLAVWLLNSGHYTTMLISIGVACCVFVVLLARRMRICDLEAVPVHLIPRAVVYVPWLAKEVVLANIDVAKRILTPARRPNISPLLFDVTTSQRTDLGRVLYANSITLTPGTVSIQVWGSRITVHAIAEDVANALAGGDMDRHVTRFEGESG